MEEILTLQATKKWRDYEINFTNALLDSQSWYCNETNYSVKINRKNEEKKKHVKCNL